MKPVIIDNNEILTISSKKPSLEDLLDSSPNQLLNKTEDDQEWLEAKLMGEEIL